MNKVLFFEISFSRFLGILLQLVFLKVYSNYLTLEELGYYYLMATLSYALNAFFLVPLDYFQQSKIYPLKHENKSLNSFLPLNLQVIKLLLFIMVLSETSVYLIYREYFLEVFLMIIFAFFLYLNNLLRGFLNNLEYRRNAVYTLLGENILKIIFFIIFIQFFHPTSTVLLLSTTVAGSLIGLTLLTLIMRKKEYQFSDTNTFKLNDILHFSYPISFGAVMNWIQLQGYRMILTPLGYVEVIGLYATVSNIGQAGMNAASTVYAQLFVPNLYKSHGNYIKKYMVFALVTICLVLCVGLIFSNELTTLLTNSKFAEYSYIIGYGIFAESGNFIIGGLSIYLTIHRLTKKTIMATWSGFVVFLVSFLFFYYSNNISVWTIGIPIILSQLSVAVYLVYYIFKIHRRNLNE